MINLLFYRKKKYSFIIILKFNIIKKNFQFLLKRVKLFYIIFIFSILIYKNFKKKNNIIIPKYLNINLNNLKKNKIKLGIYALSLRNGGRARITCILVNFLSKINIFNIYLYTISNKNKNEYPIPNNIKRITLKNNLLQKIKENQIDILIYQLSDIKEIEFLNKQKKIKVIFYIHSSIFYWFYTNKYYYFKQLYKAYKNAKYIITIVPLENDYVFKKWGINSILMNNFITYEYDSVIPSDLSSKTILTIGRASSKKKRIDLGIKAMKYILTEIPECQLKIISKLSGTESLQNLINKLHLEKNIEFVGYTLKPEQYFKNASLHLFPSLTESFGMVLAETKIYGIPNILLGLDYVSIAKGGTIIIYDDQPKTIAKEAIKILQNYRYRKKLGKEARKSMKKYNNQLLKIKWIELILSIYKGDYYYEMFKKKGNELSTKYSLYLLNNQIKLFKLRLKYVKGINIKQFENFTY